MSTPSLIEERRERLAGICLALPEAEARPTISQHTAFEVRGKKFAYYLVNHHGDGRVALWCRAGPGMRDVIVGSDPARFFVPAYLGPRGWIGLDFDAADIDWDEVAGLVIESYCLIAPKRLAGLVVASRSPA